MQLKRRHLHVASDIMLLLVGALICVVLARDFLLPRRAPVLNARPAEPRIESPVRLSGIDFSASDRTLLFVLSTECPYCRASEPFYRELLAGHYKNVRMAAALSQPLPEAQAYLRKAELHFPQVASADLTALGVAGTPTLILTDKKGNVLNSWRGKLAAEAEMRVTDALEAQP